MIENHLMNLSFKVLFFTFIRLLLVRLVNEVLWQVLLLNSFDGQYHFRTRSWQRIFVAHRFDILINVHIFSLNATFFKRGKKGGNIF